MRRRTPSACPPGYGWISAAWPVWWVAIALLPLPLLACTWAYWFAKPDDSWRVHRMSIVFAMAAVSVAALLVLPYFPSISFLPAPGEDGACAAAVGADPIAA